VTSEQVSRIKGLAETGLQSHEIHKGHFPELELWEIHNAIHFDARCKSKKDLIQAILKLHPDVAKVFERHHKRPHSELTLVILHHESKIMEAKLRASELHRKNSNPDQSAND